MTKELERLIETSRINQRMLEQVIRLQESGGVVKVFYSTKDAALFTGVSEQYLRDNKEKIGFIWKGTKLLFKGKDLQKWMDTTYQKPVRQ